MAKVASTQVGRVRAFNRFYTRQIGLLNGKLFRSDYSLTEVRVLFELARRRSVIASELGSDLGLDAGYLSRILKRFRARGLVASQRSETDGRQSILVLTEAGRKEFEPLDKAADDEVAALMERLSPEERARLTAAMQEIVRLLEGDLDSSEPYALRSPVPGDYGWIIHRQAVLYNREYGWDETYEGLVAEIVGAFSTHLEPGRERCWIAERHREVIGCIFCVKASDIEAKLRLLYVEPEARGLGIGRRLVDEVIGFARDSGYRTLSLWTNDVLMAARRIYEAAGFTLVAEEPHRSFGKDLVGQTWKLDL